MWYVFTVELENPAGDNEVIGEALAIMGGRKIADEGAWQQWFASTPYPIDVVRSHLLRHSRDDQRVHVVALPVRPKMLKSELARPEQKQPWLNLGA